MSTKPAMTDVVTAIELASLRRDRERVEAQRVELERLAQSVREREQDVIARIEAGILVDGPAAVVTRRRQNISWLTIVKRELGESTILRVKDEWPTVFYKELKLS